MPCIPLHTGRVGRTMSEMNPLRYIELDERDWRRLRDRVLILEEQIKELKGLIDEQRVLLTRLEDAVERKGVE